MTLRRRFALVAAAAVAIAILLASGIVYVVVRGELRGQLDDELRAAAPARLLGAMHEDPPPGGLPGGGAGGPGPLVRQLPAPRDALGLQTAYVAVVGSDGQVVAPPDGSRLPVSRATRAVAAGARGPFFADAQVDGADVRVFTSPGPAGYAIQVARPLADVNRTLDRLALVLVLVSAGGIALAAALGRLVAPTAVRPVGRLTDAAEH